MALNSQMMILHKEIKHESVCDYENVDYAG